MNVSNAAYSLPLTINTPSLQKEGIDPLRTDDKEASWYEPIEAVKPRKYHKYAHADLLEKLYGKDEEEEGGEGGDDPVDPEPEPQPEPTPEPEPEPEPAPEPEPQPEP